MVSGRKPLAGRSGTESPLYVGMETAGSMFTRREFIAASVLASAALAACKHTQYTFLSESEAATLTAICDQIIPADDFPSASQAGVLTYIDRQLTRHYRRHQKAYRDGLKHANLMSRNRFGVDLAAASPQQGFDIAIAKNGSQNTVLPVALASGELRVAHRVHGHRDPY